MSKQKKEAPARPFNKVETTVDLSGWYASLWHAGKREGKSDPSCPQPGDPNHCILCAKRHDKEKQEHVRDQ